ncbi:MAG: HDIG domain-containing protein [Treponema sp.]|jgi:putative nucleotidyltransferase with HDIG domain|nr:HDIG domain-containing protein [Treponema sp.]
MERILKEIAAVFTANGKKVFLVGGGVRDTVRGENPKDFDLATDAEPDEVCAMFRKQKYAVIPTGIKHGTVTVFFKNIAFETTTFRAESDYVDGRHPQNVSFSKSIEEDLSRRDFTMNAIAVDLPSGRLLDPFGGIADIKKRLIRCVGNPLDRFGEDGLRPLRACRFAAQLGFSADEALLAAIPQTLQTAAKVSIERVRDEFTKILLSQKPSVGLLLMEKTGLLQLFVSELADCRGVEQKGFHRFDVLDHSLLACDCTSTENCCLEVRLAALFHDIGKPSTRRLDESGVWTFYRHEHESVRLCRLILMRFRFPNTVIDTTCHLVAEHMFFYTDRWTDAAVRRFIIRVGVENLTNLYSLRRADAFATTGQPLPTGFLSDLIARVDMEIAEKRAFSLKNLAVSGKDLIGIGIKPGPRMGAILKELLDSVVRDPELNTREKLLEVAGKMQGNRNKIRTLDL